MDNERKMRDLRLCLLNDLRGIELSEHADLYGFRVLEPEQQWTLYTIYCAPNGFSAYIAEPDVERGIDCADERPIVENAPLFTAVSKIKADHRRVNPDAYREAFIPLRPYGGAWESPR